MTTATYSHSCTGDGSQWRAGCKLDEADLNELLCDNVNEFLHNKYSYVTQILFRWTYCTVTQGNTKKKNLVSLSISYPDQCIWGSQHLQDPFLLLEEKLHMSFIITPQILVSKPRPVSLEYQTISVDELNPFCSQLLFTTCTIYYYILPAINTSDGKLLPAHNSCLWEVFFSTEYLTKADTSGAFSNSHSHTFFFYTCSGLVHLLPGAEGL